MVVEFILVDLELSVLSQTDQVDRSDTVKMGSNQTFAAQTTMVVSWPKSTFW